MTFTRLKARILGYLQATAADLTQDGVDLVLDAVNQLRADAQRERDFESAKDSNVDIVIPPAGLSLAAIGVKKILSLRYADVDHNHPIDFTDVETWNKRPGENLTVVQLGTTLSVRPLTTDTITFVGDVVRFLPDYSGTDLTAENPDFFMAHGANWMAWEAVVRLNYMEKEFVYRQEGNLPPPDKLAEKAWMQFITYDSHLIYSGDTELTLD